MNKRIIIILSLVLVAVSAIVLVVLFLRSRALTDGLNDGVATSATGSGGIDRPKDEAIVKGSSTETVPQAGPCGDGVCSAGEAWCKQDCGSAEDRFLGSITAVDVLPTSFKITWKTDKPSTGDVRYGLTDRYELGSVSSSIPSKAHSVQISGLSPGKNYVVGVSVTEEDGTKREAPSLSFETPSSAR
jgi:hypothetical protein